MSTWVPASGVVNLAVTGFNDEDFEGMHDQSGGYCLIIPEPVCVLVLLAGVPALRRRRGA